MTSSVIIIMRNVFCILTLFLRTGTSLCLSNTRHVPTSRRSLIEKAIVLPTTIAILNSNNVEVANAASPLIAGEADNIGARLERNFIRPKVPKVLRQRLDKDFAVLLMRSSYNALDELDCVGMDQFQRDFFLIRQAEYLPYIESLGPGSVKQGDLQDANYFDFISFAQYATINREMSGNPPVVFEERQGLPDENDPDKPMTFVPTIVRRKTEYLDNSKLPIEHGRLVGNAILKRFDDVFNDTSSALPTFTDNQTPDSQMLLSAFDQLLKLFLINGFAYDASVYINTSSSNGKSAKYTMTLTSPATLWSGKSLQARNSKLINDFLLKTVKAFISQRTAYNVLNPSVKYVDNKEITSFTIA